MAYSKFSSFSKAARMLTTSFFVGYNQGGDNFRIQYTDFIQQLDLAGGAGGGVPIYIEGTQLPSIDNEGNPLEKGDWGILEQGKTYTNINGGSDITTPAGRLSFTQFDGSKWILIDMGALPTPPPVTKEDIQEFAYLKEEYVTQFLNDTVDTFTMSVDGVQVTDPLERKGWLKKLDQAFKGLKVFGLKQGVFLGVRQFTFNPEGNMSIGFVQLPNATEDFNVNHANIPFNSGAFDYTKPFTIGMRERFSSLSILATFDLSVLGNHVIAMNFRNGNDGIANYKKIGIKNSAITHLHFKNIWYLKQDLRTTGANANPENLWFHEALKSVRLKCEEKALVRFQNANYNFTSGNIQFIIPYCADDEPDNLLVTSSRNRFGYLRINLPLELTGLQRIKSYVLTGPISSLEIEILIDMDFLKTNIPYIATDNLSVSGGDDKADWIVEPVSSGGGGIVTSLNLVEGGNDFQGNFRFSASSNWIWSSGYNMTKLARIPEGTETLDFQMSFSGEYSNALFLDKDMKLVSRAYAGTTTVNNLLGVVPPENAVFVLASTETPTGSASIVAKGAFEISEEVKTYRSIHEGLADKISGSVFRVKDILFEKTNEGLCTINEYKCLSSDWLDDVKEWEKDGAFIVPNGVLHTDGVTSFNGGTLCSIKDDVMYFYNARECAVFKSEDGGNTYTTIVDKFSHPNVWDTQDINNESRSMVIPLENGELLIPIRVRGEVINPAINENRYRYWTMWRTTNGQTDIEKCFEFSYESSPDRPWLPDTEPQRMWPNHSGGCLLGDFTQYVFGDTILVTEYGAGTSIYWNYEGVANNARGISGKAWVSFDAGVTWKKCFDADRKKSGTSEADNNWYYFTDFYAGKMRHMHGCHIDEVRKVAHLTNGDWQDYDWNISLEDLKTWYDSAPAVDPDEKPEYKVTDTFPEWNIEQLTPGTGNSVYSYSAMKYQMMQGRPVKMGNFWGHDASREFAYMSHYDDNGEYVFEPVFQFEQRADFPDEKSFSDSWTSTDGFVQQVIEHGGIFYLTHSNGGTRPARVYATKDGLSYKIVYQGDNGDIKFAGKILFGNNIAYMSNGQNGQDSRTAGYWKLKPKSS